MNHWSFMGDGADAEPSLSDKVDTVEVLQWLLACLRAQYWNYQQAHWQSQGSSSYGDHLLFQRLYESVVDQTDTLAEKMVGTCGPESVDGLDLGAKFEFWVRRWSATDCLHKRGLLSEEDFQSTCKRVYELLGENGDLTLGMDDFLMATANEHETNQYLLQQVLRAKTQKDGWSALFDFEKE